MLHPAAARPLTGSRTADESASDWIPLFDGRSLAGWRAAEHPDTWSVDQGQLIAKGPRSHLFYTGPVGNADFRNFELEAEIKTGDQANSGIYFHTEYQETGWPDKGYEVQINNTYPGVGELPRTDRRPAASTAYETSTSRASQMASGSGCACESSPIGFACGSMIFRRWTICSRRTRRAARNMPGNGCHMERSRCRGTIPPVKWHSGRSRSVCCRRMPTPNCRIVRPMRATGSTPQRWISCRPSPSRSLTSIFTCAVD